MYAHGKKDRQMLFRKMLRDLRKNAVQFLAVFIMSFISLAVTAGVDGSTSEALDEYLMKTNYRDIDIQGLEFSKKDINNIEKMDEVKSVVGSFTSTGTTEIEGKRKMTLSFITDNDVSSMYVIEGEKYKKGTDGIWLDDRFCKAHKVKVGDEIKVNSEVGTFKQKVKGTVYSPQYLYYTPDDSYIGPEYGEYGFGIMDISQLKSEEVVFDQLLVEVNGVDNQLNLTEEENNKIDATLKKLKKYFNNDYLVSFNKVQDIQMNYYLSDIGGSAAMWLAFPTLFGLVALMGIVSTMTRLIAKQKNTIGTLKALGFHSRRIIVHYVSYGVFIVLLGCILGSITGYFTMGNLSKESMVTYYNNPLETIRVSPCIYIYTALLVGGTIIVSYICMKKVIKMTTASILQPTAPKVTKLAWYENMSFWKKLKNVTKWNFRDIGMNKFRTSIAILGILACSSLIYSSVGFLQSLSKGPEQEYKTIISAKSIIQFDDSVNYEKVSHYEKKYGGQMIEENGISLSSDKNRVNSNLKVLDKGDNYRILDVKGKYTNLSEDGITITRAQAQVLKVGIGDSVSFYIIGTKKTYKEKIVAISRNPIDQGIIISKKKWEQMKGTFTPNILYTESEVDKKVANKEEILSVFGINELYDKMVADCKKNYYIAMILIVVAVIVGLVIIYNLITISYVEKYKDFATLSSIGFKSRALRNILLQQNIIVVIIGTIIGLPIGHYLTELVLCIMGEGYDYMVQINCLPATLAILTTVVFTVIVNELVSSKIKKIDLVLAIKE